MSTTVLAPSGLEISTSDSSPEEMLESLTKGEKDKTPRVLVNKGEPVKQGKDDDASKAAAVLGKKGGEAAAKARQEADKLKAKAEPAEKDAKPAAGKEGDEAGTQDDTDAAAAADKKKREGNPRHDPQARVQEATREAKEARERADRAERELQSERRERERLAREADDLRAGRQPPAREQPRQAREDSPPQIGLPPKPKSEDFESYEDYLDAREEHREKVTRHHERVAQHEHAYTGHVVGKVREFSERVTAATKEDPALLASIEELGMVTSFKIIRDEQGRPRKIERAAEIRGEHLIGDEIVTSANPAALIRHFAENRAEYQRIAALRSLAGIQREMARLEGRLERSEAATGDTSSGREVSKASSPGRSLPGSPHTAEPDLASVDFERHMDAKRRARA